MAGRDGKEPGGSPGSEDMPPTTAPAQRGEATRAEAFARWVEPEVEVLLRVAYTLTGSWSDADDVVQDTLVRAWGAVDRFDGRHPRAWLLTILRRTHLNSLRRSRPDLVEDDVLARHRPAFGAAHASSPSRSSTTAPSTPTWPPRWARWASSSAGRCCSSTSTT